MKLFILLLMFISLCNSQNYEFPENFLFGVATASYQIEGAWNVSDKGENIWDHLTHTNPGFVIDNSNGDVASDGYHKVAEDVQLMKNVGIDFYRFSLSWSRILPTGHSNYISEDGVRYYNELIDELLANDIVPLVTMFHWDLPQPLQEIGGWPNPLMADYYADYADVVFSLFGDRVKNWFTMNEPDQICEQGYGSGNNAPGYRQRGIGGYLCAHTVLRAHAKAYQIYNENYREEQQGRVGIVIQGSWAEPESDSDEDEAAAERSRQLNMGWYLHPILSEDGDYPPIMRERVDANSAAEGFPRSRLPYFTEEEIEQLKGSIDFLGLNHYCAVLCRPQDNWEYVPSYENDVGSLCYMSEDWEATSAPWVSVTPWSIRRVLNWIKNEYNNPEVVVTESGYPGPLEVMQDCRRVNYYNSYLQSLLEALYEDECNVVGYTAWSIIDLFEWNFGYSYGFGMHRVDFDDPDRPRTPRMSSYVYQNIISTRVVDTSFVPDGFEACE